MHERNPFRWRLAAVSLAALLGSAPASATGEESAQSAPAVRLFVAPDDSSETVAALDPNTSYVPVADLVGGDGARWYLVRLENGTSGWLKDSDGDIGKKLGSYFKPVPVTISLPSTNETSSAAGPSGRISVPIEMSGAKVVVAVTFNHSVTANLALDTGAAMTMISRRIARNLNLSNMGSMLMTGIGGSVVTQMARIESVKVGDAAVGNLTVSVHDFSRDPRYEGLLGLDFLNHFEMSLDARKRQLFLTPR
jgi:hypothetical protein